MKCIGEEVTEKIDRVPAGLVRPKYASWCGAAEGQVAPSPARYPESTRTMPFSAADLAFVLVGTRIFGFAELPGN